VFFAFNTLFYFNVVVKYNQKRILEGAKMNFEHTFDEIVEQYYRAIYNYCQVRLGDESATEDCTQEVFLTLYKKMDKLRLSENIRAWLYRTADNVIKNYRRKNRKIISLDDKEVEQLSSEDVYEVDNPFDGFISAEDVELLKAYYIDGESALRISRRTKKSEAAIFQRIHRIKMKLKKYMCKLNKM
jgi:RNA polymerase sigma factor (sigma-70 family)